MKPGILVLFSLLFISSGVCQTTPLPSQLNRSMEQVWIHPKSTPAQVEVFKHLEIGYKLRMEERRSIDNFLDNRPVPRSLNPFDPASLSFETLFYRIDPKTNDTLDVQSRYGFWYREYERDYSSATPDDWNHRELNTDFNVRVRFTPEEPGLWRAQSMVIIDLKDTVLTNSTTFQVISGMNSAFLKVGSTNRFLERDGKTFFPVGQNLPWPTCSNEIDELCDSIYCAGKEPWCHARIMGPYGFEIYEREMAALANADANYFRMLIAPWNLEIEFEELGNYDKRMHCAWEMDRILEQAEELGVLVHFNLQVHYPLEDPSVYSMFHWDFGDLECSPWDEPYCYFDELNLKTPEDFLKSEEARKHYKNRLRYLIARYGHSTAIGALELLSEANNTGNGPQIGTDCKEDKSQPSKLPYANQDGFAALIGDWQKDMVDFIKEDLNHTSHLIAVDYTGLPDIKNGDDSFYSPNVDLACWNYYNAAIEKFSGFPLIVDQFQQQRINDRKSPYPLLDKPMLFSEIGPGAEVYDCDNDMRWKKAAWMSALGGLAGSAMNWNNQHDTLLWQTLGRINKVMQEIPLNEGAYLSFNDVRKDELADLVGLYSTKGEKHAIGLVHNRTVNFYTRWDPSGRKCIDPLSLKDLVLREPYMEAKTIDPGKSKNRLTVKKLGLFKKVTVTYRSIETLETIKKEVVSTGVNGRVHLNYPSLSAQGEPMILFEIE